MEEKGAALSHIRAHAQEWSPGAAALANGTSTPLSTFNATTAGAGLGSVCITAAY